MFEDILQAHKLDRYHFTGSVVYSLLKTENKIDYYVIIDGQQRLTTIYILIKALIDVAETEGEKDELTSVLFNVDKFKITKYNLTIAQIVAAKRGEDITLEDGTVVANSELTYLPFEPRSYAYLSDTSRSAVAAERVKGVSLLYHEATYGSEFARDAKERGHSTATDAAQMAVIAGAERLIMGHFSSRYKSPEVLLEQAKEIFENSALAEEGETYTV